MDLTPHIVITFVILTFVISGIVVLLDILDTKE